MLELRRSIFIYNTMNGTYVREESIDGFNFYHKQSVQIKNKLYTVDWDTLSVVSFTFCRPSKDSSCFKNLVQKKSLASLKRQRKWISAVANSTCQAIFITGGWTQSFNGGRNHQNVDKYDIKNDKWYP